MRRSLIPAWSKAWPVVEVNQTDCAVVGDNTVASIDMYVQHLRCPAAKLLQCLFVERNAFSRTVYLFPTKLAMV